MDNVEQMFKAFDERLKKKRQPAAIEKIASLSIHSE